MPKTEAKDEPEEAVGAIMTQIDCPCGEVFSLEGDREGEVVDCECGKIKLRVRRL